MSCNAISRELQSEMSGSWLDWMGARSSDVSGAPSLEVQKEAAPAFQPEEVRALYREVFDALQVPRRLSGPRRVRRGPFEIASEIFPAQFFSGDFVSVFDTGDATFLALGDIAGKGLTAAMWSTHILGLVRTYAAAMCLPQAVLEAMNRDLYMLGSAPLTTMVLARLDWRKGELEYSNAGHFAPLLHRSNGEVEQLSAGGPLLAAIHDARFNAARVPFSAGDMLVSYTDGLIECRSQRGEEFGLERLRAGIRQCARLGANEALFSIVGAAQDFAAGSPRNDDLTLMVVAKS
jgi:sigma-B regulation protein RsbU (phosphoserine phosphatase)